MQHYDVAVIGTQRAGTIAAALLSKRGARVLLLDHGENGATYCRNGLQLPLVPELVPALTNAPHVKRVVQELGLMPELRRRLTPLEPSFQAIMPGHRVDLSSDCKAVLRELKAEFPDVDLSLFFMRLFEIDDQLTDLLDTDPPLLANSLRDKLRARGMAARVGRFGAPFEDSDLLDGIAADHPVRDLLLSPLAFFGYLPDRSPSVFQAVRLLACYWRGTFANVDALGGISSLLFNAVEDAGVDVRRDAVVKDLSLSGRKLASIRVEGDRTEYSAEFFVANTLGSFHDIVPPGRHHQKFVAEEQEVLASGTLFVMNLVVERDVMSPAMGDAVFLLNGRRTARGEEPADPPIFLRRYPAQRRVPGIAHSGEPSAIEESDKEILSVACPARTRDIKHSPERLSAMRTLLFERVRRVVPFLADYLVDTSLPVDTAEWDIEGRNRRIDPLSVHPVFEFHVRSALGIAGRPPQTYFKNLLHTGMDVLPGLGLEGEYVAGWTAAKVLSAMAGNRWQRF